MHFDAAALNVGSRGRTPPYVELLVWRLGGSCARPTKRRSNPREEDMPDSYSRGFLRSEHRTPVGLSPRT